MPRGDDYFHPFLSNNSNDDSSGITIREHMAMEFMVAHVVHNGLGGFDTEGRAISAVAHADALLKALERA